MSEVAVCEFVLINRAFASPMSTERTEHVPKVLDHHTVAVYPSLHRLGIVRRQTAEKLQQRPAQ